MSDKQIEIEVGGLALAAFWLVVGMWVLAFAGEPDLMDAIIYKLTGGSNQVRVQEDRP